MSLKNFKILHLFSPRYNRPGMTWKWIWLYIVYFFFLKKKRKKAQWAVSNVICSIIVQPLFYPHFLCAIEQVRWLVTCQCRNTDVEKPVSVTDTAQCPVTDDIIAKKSLNGQPVVAISCHLSTALHVWLISPGTVCDHRRALFNLNWSRCFCIAVSHAYSHM